VEPDLQGLSRETLELFEWLLDGVTLAANHPDFEGQAARISAAKREMDAALTAAGGTPLSVQRSV
jgi:hypothetical protein